MTNDCSHRLSPLRFFTLSGLSLSGLLLLAACGGGSGSSDTTSASADAAPATSESGAANPAAAATVGVAASVAADATTCGGVGQGVTQNPSARLVLQVAGSQPGVSHDALQVDGNARLGGTLELVFGDAYVPVKGQQFTVVTASCIAGTFQRVEANKGITLVASQTNTQVKVTVQ